MARTTFTVIDEDGREFTIVANTPTLRRDTFDGPGTATGLTTYTTSHGHTVSEASPGAYDIFAPGGPFRATIPTADEP